MSPPDQIGADAGPARTRARAGRDVRTLFALGGASTAAFLPFFVLLLSDRGLTADRIGFVLSLASLAGVLSVPFWSHVADARLGGVRTLQLTSFATAIAALALIPTGSNVWAIALVTALLYVVSAPGTALSDTIALQVLGPERETDYGRIRLWASLGWAIAVVLFGAWYQRMGLGPVLPAYAAGTLAYAIAAMRFPATRPARHAGTASRLGSVGEALRVSPRLLPFLIGLLLVSISTSAAWSFLPLRIVSRGGGPLLIGLSAGLGALVEIPFFRASAWLGGRFSLRTLYASGVGIWIAMLVAWSLVPNPVIIAAIKVAGGAGFGLTYAALVVITGRLVPLRLRNTGQALMQTFGAGIGPIVGAALGGLVYRHLGAPALFAGAAVSASLGLLVVWRALAGDLAGGGPSVRSGVD